MSKTTSAGTIIFVGDKVLLGHVTNAIQWDLPKGKIDGNEEPIEAAVRECREEFGMIIRPENMSSLGHFKYRKDKDLILFFTAVKDVDLSKLKCTSYVNNDLSFPEIDNYKLVDVDDLPRHFAPAMDRVFASNGLYTLLSRLRDIEHEE